MCPPMWAHWRHLANTIELVLPSAHSSPQPKRQIDRFSRFCTAHGRVSSGTLAPRGEYDWNCALCGPWLIRLNLCFLRTTRVHNPKENRSAQPFCTAHSRKSLYFTMGDLSPKVAPAHGGDLYPHLIHDYLGKSQRIIQMVSRSVQPFSHRWPQSVLYFTMGRPFPLKIAPSNGWSRPI